MAFRWRADDGSTLNAGLVALLFFRGSGQVLLKNTIFLLFFREGLDPMSSLWIHACTGSLRKELTAARVR